MIAIGGLPDLLNKGTHGRILNLSVSGRRGTEVEVGSVIPYIANQVIRLSIREFSLVRGVLWEANSNFTPMSRQY